VEPSLIAKFVFGPLDGEFLILPTEVPWTKFVLPEKHNKILVQHFYLLGAQLDDHPPIWSYLFDGDIETIWALS
jgi:hypothetical protein